MASGTEYSRDDVLPSLTATRQAGMEFETDEILAEREKAANKLILIHTAQASVNVQPVQGIPSFQKNGSPAVKVVTANVNIQEKQPEESTSGDDILKLVGIGILAWIVYKLVG